MRTTLVLVAIVGAALVAGGVYYVNGPMKCQGLEEDYLNAVGSLRSTAATRAIAEEGGDLDRALDAMQESGYGDAERALTRLYDECGSRAGQTAARKGSELLLSGV